MTAPRTAYSENCVSAAYMSDSDSRTSPLATASGLAAYQGGPGFVAVASIVIASGAAAFALLASSSAKPVLLTVLALLAMLGVFFLFAMAAGHLRLSERVSEADLARGVAERLDSAVLIANRQGTMLYCNAAWEQLAGRTPSGALQILDQRIPAGSTGAESLFRLTRAAQSRERRTEILTFGGAIGGSGPRVVRLSVRPLDLPSQESQLGPLTLWQATDLTEERQGQRARVDALEAELSVYDSAPVGLVAAGADGAVRHMNAALKGWLAPLGIEAGSVTKLSDLMSEESARLLEQTARLEAEEMMRLDLEIGKDAERRLPVTILCRRGSADQSAGFVFGLVQRDTAPAGEIVDRRVADVRFARLFQSAPFGIATVTAQGRIVNANAAFGRMLIEPRSTEGRYVADVLCPVDNAAVRASADAAIQQALAGHTNVAPIEIAVGPQGEYTRRVYLSPIAEGSGAREAAVLFLIDATEQKALETKFAQSQKMEAVGKLAGGIAHDFNNVLTAIIGFSDLLLQTHRPTDAAYKDIMNIKQSANRAAGLVRQLLAFSRRQTLQTEVLQLGEVITDLSALLNRAIGEKIDLKILTGRDLGYVKADKTQFEQVIINLAVNAADAMPDGGRVTIRTRNVSERESLKLSHMGVTPGDYVAVEVEDTGVGMSPEVMSKIFEPFFTTKGVGKGTGLGLSTVYGIVKQTGGFIYPESTPGKGTMFRVFLPRHDMDGEEEVAAQKVAKKERPGDLTGSGRVLLVEDEDVVRSFAVRALKRQGYEVLEASTGVEALEIMSAQAGRIDIVVSDVVMPEMDGPTLLKELRKTNPDMKIIFVSGYPDDAFKKSLDPNETFAFLAKPFSLPQLAAKVKEQLAC